MTKSKQPSTMNELVEDLNKQFGIEVVAQSLVIKGVVPTGSILLDEAIGIGGYPIGKITEIFGAESVGKSTLCLSAIRQAQLAGLGAAYIDAENSFDSEYAETLGVDISPEKLIVVQPESAEQALAILEKVVQSPAIGLVILDSVAAMVPKKESFGEGELGDSHVGLVARLMSQSSRRLTPMMAKSNAAVVMVNQIREQIGGSAYVMKESPGGHALKHGMHLRLELKRISTKTDYPLKGDTSIIVVVKIKKTKVSANRDATAELLITNGRGIDIKAEITQKLIDAKIIKSSGSWYKTENGDTIGQGLASVYAWIDDNPDLIKQVLEKQGVNSIYATVTQETNTDGNQTL